jgi:acetylornithine deacetylase/succinyl-diaminopimelate desuccinylase-like protein
MKKLINDLGYEVKEEPKGKPEEIFVYMEVFMQKDGSIWMDWKESQPLKELNNLIERIYEKKPFYSLAPGASDAPYLRNDKYCEQTVEFGPGDAGSMHALNEHIEIRDFINAIKVYTLFAYNFLK